MWNRASTITAAFKSLLNTFADHLLKKGAKDGRNSQPIAKLADKPGNSYLWFLHPQVSFNQHNIHCQQCHMPGKSGFTQSFPQGNCPFYIDHDPEAKTWYTMVSLGRDKHGNIVWERAHAILAAARWGIPKAVFDITLDDAHTPNALHGPCCSQCQGGCLNPLHISWGLKKRNREDQEVKRGGMNQGPTAWNRTLEIRLVPD